MKYLLPVLLVALGASACATNRPSDADRLALYQAHAGAPVTSIRYFNAMGWDRIDDQHVVLSMRPKESWLLKLSGPCLDWGTGSPVLGLKSQNSMLTAKFDKVIVEGSPMECRIEEIRPLDVKALRAAEQELREDAKPQASGT